MINMDEQPALQEWRELYEAAAEFKNSKCWEWMSDSDIFGIKSPYTGEIFYCCIMGMLGEHFGIAAYRGGEGLSFMYAINSGEFTETDEDVLHYQSCLSASFENREDLAPRELKSIKELELKFRGKNQWPVFRDYTPGYYPWFVNRAQCLELTCILREALGVALRFMEDSSILDNEDSPDSYLVRVPQKTADGFAWEDQWPEPEDLKEDYVAFTINDDLLVKRIKASKPRRVDAWEIDIFYSPAPVEVERGGRPYFPKMCLCLEPASGMVLFMHMVEDMEKKGYEFLDAFIHTVEEHKVLPRRLLICREETGFLFADLAEKLGIGLEMCDGLEMVEAFRAEMGMFFDMR